jgi:hypothetical protein
MAQPHSWQNAKAPPSRVPPLPTSASSAAAAAPGPGPATPSPSSSARAAAASAASDRAPAPASRISLTAAEASASLRARTCAYLVPLEARRGRRACWGLDHPGDGARPLRCREGNGTAGGAGLCPMGDQARPGSQEKPGRQAPRLQREHNAPRHAGLEAARLVGAPHGALPNRDGGERGARCNERPAAGEARGGSAGSLRAVWRSGRTRPSLSFLWSRPTWRALCQGAPPPAQPLP